MAVKDGVFEARTELLDHVANRVTEGFALLGPFLGPLFDLIRSVLHEDGHHVLSGRRDARVYRGRKYDVHEGPPREGAVLGVVVRPLEVVDRRRDGDVALEVQAVARQAFEGWQSVEREVDLARRA